MTTQSKNQTVEGLRRSGNKVRVIHYRYRSIDSQLLPMKEISPIDRSMYGGLTKVEVTLKDGTNLVGESKCNRIDAFNRKRGLQIALGRALKCGMKE